MGYRALIYKAVVHLDTHLCKTHRHTLRPWQDMTNKLTHNESKDVNSNTSHRRVLFLAMSGSDPFVGL